LIKDYNLQVHYHLGKANVVEDVLSQKLHCNSVQIEDSPLSRLMHPLVLHQIALEISLRNRVIELQQTNVGIHHINKKMKEEETNIFGSMRMKFYGLKISLLYQRIMSSEIRPYLKLIHLSYLFILVVVRCIRILNIYFGGQR